MQTPQTRPPHIQGVNRRELLKAGLAASVWIIAREVVEHYGDLKRAEAAVGTGPFLLERSEPNVKTVFKRHPDYFLKGLPWADGVEWLVLNDPSTGLAMYRTGQLDLMAVRQQDLEALKQSHPQLLYQDFLFPNSQLPARLRPETCARPLGTGVDRAAAGGGAARHEGAGGLPDVGR